MAGFTGRVVAEVEERAISAAVQLASSTVRPLCRPINSFVVAPLTKFVDINDEIGRLRTETLPAIESVIIKVEGALLRKEMETRRARRADERKIKADERKIEEAWFQTLKDLAYDIEDIVDEVSTETARHPLPNVTRWMTLNFWVDLVCSCFAPSCLGYSDIHRLERCSFKFYVQVAYRIAAVYTELKHIENEKERLKILPNIIMGSQLPFANITTGVDDDETYEFKHHVTTSVSNKVLKPVGRDEEKSDIIGRLMDPKSEMLVIPIIGLPGMGKTTLARLVFDDERIKTHFNFKKWVFVGINFNAKLLMGKHILGDSESTDDLNKLYEMVVREIKDKTFLIVLDDVWDDDRKNWTDFLTPLSHGRPGSRIIITTRSERVAKIACNTTTYCILNPLSRDYSVELFEKHAFPDGCLEKHSNLRVIGGKIVDRLEGLPLALEVVGSALRGDSDERKWLSILNENICVADSVNGYDIMPVLLWSYHRLPYHLKQCFRYRSIFPRDDDYGMTKSFLIALWIANGYIQPKENKSLEDIGNEYMNDLVSASLFRYGTSDEDSTASLFRYGTSDEDSTDSTEVEFLKMHDLIYDLAVLVSKGEIFRIEKNTGSCMDPTKIRHLAICDGRQLPNSMHWDRLHSLVIMDETGTWEPPMEILSQLRSIRVLHGVAWEKIQSFTRNLLHLRFLLVTDVDILHVSLEPLKHLNNLQTLMMDVDVDSDEEDDLPMEYVCPLPKLTSLRVLKFGLEGIGVDGVGNLTSLRFLRAHGIHDKDGCGIKELKNLSQLHGELAIYKLENVKGGFEESREAMLHEKRYLEKLQLAWTRTENVEELDSAQPGSASHCANHEAVLDGLQPHPNLKKLSIYEFGGSNCRPRWMGEQLTGMVEIKLENCRNLVDLPPLGQLPRLKKLVFWDLDRLQRVTRQFYGKVACIGGVVFPSLETLEFNGIPRWQEWQGVHGNNMKWFPSLQQLNISGCEKLEEVPHLPSSVRRLYMDGASIIYRETHHGLEVKHCPKLESFEAACVLEKVDIGKCSFLASFSISVKSINSLEISDCPKLREISIECSHNLAAINVMRCPSLIHLAFGSLDSVENLVLVGCRNPANITAKKVSSQSASTSVQYLLPNVKRLETDCRDLLQASNPTKLTHLSVRFTDEESTCFTDEETQWWQSLTSLSTLLLTNADHLLLSSWLSNLFRNAVSLEVLLLNRCRGTRSFPESELPRSLQRLDIKDCPHLAERYEEGRPGRQLLLNHIPHLQIRMY